MIRLLTVLNIFLLILKIIGIILLVIFLIAVALISVVLFVPVHYVGDFEYKGSIKGQCNINWFFKAFAFYYSIDGENSDFKIKLPFGLERLLEKEKQEMPSGEDTVYKTDLPAEEDFQEDFTVYDLENEIKAETEKITEKVISEEKEDFKSFEYENFEESDLTEKRGLKYFFQRKILKLKSLADFVKDKKAFIDKNIAFYEDLKAKYDLKAIFNKTILLIKKIFKGLGLKLFQICGIIGLDNPCTTGQVIGLISVIQTFIPVDINIQGDFENQILEGSLKIKGKVRLSGILFPIIGYIVTKPVRTVVIDYVKGDKK